MFHREACDAMVVVHGGDFVSLGSDEARDWFQGQLEEAHPLSI